MIVGLMANQQSTRYEGYDILTVHMDSDMDVIFRWMRDAESWSTSQSMGPSKTNEARGEEELLCHKQSSGVCR